MSDVGTVGLGRSELLAISVEVMPLGGTRMPLGGRECPWGDENAYAALHWGELTSWGLTAGKEGGWSLYFPRTPYLVNGEWTKDLTGVCLVFDGVVLWYPGVGLG